jgi:hypothetical protein
LFAPVDAYCERLDASFWSEPVNAATNAGFLLAGVLLWRVVAQRRALGKTIASSVRSLPWLLGLIGLCSFLFHTVATVWAGLADTHFLWHLLNAAVLFLLSRELVQETTRARPG